MNAQILQVKRSLHSIMHVIVPKKTRDENLQFCKNVKAAAYLVRILKQLFKREKNDEERLSTNRELFFVFNILIKLASKIVIIEQQVNTTSLELNYRYKQNKTHILI